MKKHLLWCLTALAVLASLTAAHAATDVTIPVGEWGAGLISFITTFVAPAIGVVVVWLFRNVPAAYVTAQNRSAVEQLLEKAVMFGLNTAKANLPENVTVPITNDVIAAAAKYAISHGPAIVEWAGGAAKIEEKILARLNVTPIADA